MTPQQIKLFWEKVHKTETCWLWTASQFPNGYGQSHINRYPTGAHVVSWIIEFGQIEKGLMVLHTCDVKLCVRPSHLFLGTGWDNIQDMIKKGRAVIPVGSKHHRTTIAESDVLFIRKSYPKISQTELAKKFNLKPGTISGIISRRTWRHV